MYGSYGMYSGKQSNFSVANMYKPAGVVNITSGYQMNGNSLDRSNNGVPTSAPTTSYTSTIIGLVGKESFQQTTNVSYAAQHVDYQQNPSPVIISVRQLDNTDPSNQKIYQNVEEINGRLQTTDVGIFSEQLSTGNVIKLSTSTNLQTTVPGQNIIN